MADTVYAKIRILNFIFKILEILDLGHVYYWMMQKNVKNEL